MEQVLLAQNITKLSLMVSKLRMNPCPRVNFNVKMKGNNYIPARVTEQKGPNNLPLLPKL